MTRWLRAGWLRFGVIGLLLVVFGGELLMAQAVTTTTVQGTVYLANGAPGTGTLLVSWPAFTTTGNQAVAAGKTSVQIGADGFVSVNLTPNLGANPAGLYYTAVFHLSDGTVNTEYWVVPAAATASLAQVRAKLMPAAQAVQTVSKAYVDEAIAELQSSLLTASGGTLTGLLVLCCDPTTPLMAADKHYVDQLFAQGISATGGTILGPLNAPSVNGVYSPLAGTAQTNLQTTQAAAVAAGGSMAVPPTYAGTDAFANTSGIRVEDLRAAGAQQHERSVKEFGAVCDGVKDDTSALQAALNFAQAQYAAGHGVALTLPAGVCKTHQLVWHLESIGGQGRQVSGLMGFPGEDVLATVADASNLLGNTRLHDLTIYVDQSVDVSCTPTQGRAAAGSCGANRPIESSSILSAGGNGLTGTAGSGAGWWIGNCAIAIPATLGSLDAQVVVRSVSLAYRASQPDLVQYSIAFSNDWANDLSVKTSRMVPSDAWLPATVSPTYLANLNELVVTAISSTALGVQTSVAPPVGGGFEVRRRDFAFQAGIDSDLVMRSAVGAFDIPRAMESDRFYVRTYDGATPPNYSEFSAALFVNLPLSI